MIVPAIGLDNCVIEEKLPSMYIDKWYYDTLNQSSTISVEGLLSGESYTIGDVIDGKFNISFYKDAAKTQNGLLSNNGSSRVITITLETLVNQEWLNNETAQGSAYMVIHKNRVTYHANEEDLSASAEVTLVKKAIDKWQNSVSTITIDGVSYPAYEFKLLLRGVDEDGITISDAFDTSLWKLYTGDEATDKVLSVYGGDAYNQVKTDGDTSISFVNVSDGIQIKVNKFPRVNAESDGKIGGFYGYYKIEYTLIPKDAEALKTLSEKSLQADDGKVTLSNTAEWGDEKSTATAEYSYDPLSKSTTQWAGEWNKYIAQYKIVINENRAALNGGNTLTVTDTMSASLRFQPESLVVKADGIELADVEYNVSGGVLTIKVPDEKVIEITYSARVMGESYETITYNNNVQVAGIQDASTTTNSVKMGVSSGGTASFFYINLKKHVYGNLNSALAGAEFELEEYDGQKWVPVYDINGKKVTVTSGADGLACLGGLQDKDGWSFYENTRYRVTEIKAPEGYLLDSTPIEFVLKTTPSADGEYAPGETIPIANAVENFHIIKVDTDDNTNVLQGAVFTLTGLVEGKEQTVEVTTDENGIAAFSKLEVGTYTLKEKAAPTDYVLDDTEYQVEVYLDANNELAVKSNTDGLSFEKNAAGKYEAVVTNVLQTGILKLTKTLTGDGDLEWSDVLDVIEFTITPGVDGSTSSIYKLTDSAFTQVGDSYVLTLSDVPVGTYTVEETKYAVDGYNTSTMYKVDSEDATTTAASAEVTDGGSTSVEVTNEYTEKVGTLVLTKTLSEDSELGWDEVLDAIEFTITAEDNTVYGTYKLSDSAFTQVGDAYVLTLTDVPEGTYTVEETKYAVDGYVTSTTYKVNSGEATTTAASAEVTDGGSTSVEVTNEYTMHTGNLQITKSFSGLSTTEVVEVKDKISFTISPAIDGISEYTLKDVEAGADGNYVLSFDGIPTGEYTVTETIHDLEDYSESVSYKVAGTESNKVSVEKNATAEMDVTNTYTYVEPTPTPTPTPSPTPAPTPVPTEMDEMPKTSDEAPVGLLFALMLFSFGGMIVVYMCAIRRERNRDE